MSIDGVSHKASKLDIAKEVLRRFGIILLLDHFAETIPLLCAELNWQHCTARVKAHNEKIYKERSQNILNHARQIWPPRNSTKGCLTSPHIAREMALYGCFIETCVLMSLTDRVQKYPEADFIISKHMCLPVRTYSIHFTLAPLTSKRHICLGLFISERVYSSWVRTSEEQAFRK